MDQKLTVFAPLGRYNRNVARETYHVGNIWLQCPAPLPVFPDHSEGMEVGSSNLVCGYHKNHVICPHILYDLLHSWPSIHKISFKYSNVDQSYSNFEFSVVAQIW